MTETLEIKPDSELGKIIAKFSPMDWAQFLSECKKAGLGPEDLHSVIGQDCNTIVVSSENREIMDKFKLTIMSFVKNRVNPSDK